MNKKRIVSGMRPTGRMHLGHLHGALYNWKGLQENYDCFYFVADWHALTSEYSDTRIIKESTLDIIIDWISVGLDPEVATFFIQSQIKEHAELHVIFSMITPLAWLERNPTYKEQLQELELESEAEAIRELKSIRKEIEKKEEILTKKLKLLRKKYDWEIT